MSLTNESITLVTKYEHICDSNEKIIGRKPAEWSVLGFTTSNADDVKKAKSAMVLHESVSGLQSVMTSINELETVASRISSKYKVYPSGSEAGVAAKALSEKIKCFRSELFRDYLDLVTDPEFLIAAVKLGDRVSISNHSFNEDSV
jgi:hypothetical protein